MEILKISLNIHKTHRDDGNKPEAQPETSKQWAASQSSGTAAALESPEVTMDQLKYIYARRAKLTELGFPNVSRNFSHKRRVAAHQFQDLAQSEPAVYGEIGSDSWIRGYLCHLNEPGVVSWDDVVCWLHKYEFVFKGKVNTAVCNKRKLVPATISGGDEIVRKVARLKHAVIALRKCNDMKTEGKAKAQRETSGKTANRINTKKTESTKDETTTIEPNGQASQSECSARCEICVIHQRLADNFGRLADITLQLIVDSRKPEFCKYNEIMSSDLHFIRHVYLEKGIKYQNHVLECGCVTSPIMSQ